MGRLLVIIGVIPAAAAGDLELANVTALLVALGTLAAGIVAYLRLRSERPKVIAEMTKTARDDLRAEVETAWRAVDRLRLRERELEDRVDELERANERQARRIVELELIVREAGLGPLGA